MEFGEIPEIRILGDEFLPEGDALAANVDRGASEKFANLVTLLAAESTSLNGSGGDFASAFRGAATVRAPEEVVSNPRAG